ncbi:MAG: hypothetical protein F6K31_27615 [Symploca sp. SIO2G7]|nr:hypothetical protein [Symploca sp. SIO2G7]
MHLNCVLVKLNKNNRSRLPVACCLLPVACCLLPVAYRFDSQLKFPQ